MSGQDPSAAGVPPGMLRHPLGALALGFGSGCVPRAPGTAGTLTGLVLYLALAPLPAAWYVAVVALAFLAGIGICGRAERLLGRSDHPAVVWDEIVGIWVTLTGVPVQWPWLLAGFLAFRFFDIVKPWPVGLADRRLHGGFGVMADDLLAGLLACAGLHLMLYIL